jgi:hypothetical protein
LASANTAPAGAAFAAAHVEFARTAVGAWRAHDSQAAGRGLLVVEHLGEVDCRHIVPQVHHLDGAGAGDAEQQRAA